MTKGKERVTSSDGMEISEGGFADPREGHILELNFGKSSQGVTHNNNSDFFQNTATWKAIPRFVILTGKNGIGKSRLLNYMNDVLLKKTHKQDTENVVYIDATHNLSNYSTSRNSDPSWYLDPSRFDAFVDGIEACLTKKKEPDEDSLKFALAEIEKYCKKNNLKKRDLKRDRIEEIIKKRVDYRENQLRIKEPLRFLNTIFQIYTQRVEANKKVANMASNMLALYEHYAQKSKDDIVELHQAAYIDNSGKLNHEEFMSAFAQNRLFQHSIIDSYAQAISPPCPWNEINNILTRYGFKYRVIYRDDSASGMGRGKALVFEKDNVPLSPEKLSSGELTAIAMMTWLFCYQGLSDSANSNKQQLENKTKIMLLDEPDKHLDPKLCKMFFKIIYNEFVKRQGIQVIMTTHRIDTVILAPEDCIYTLRSTDFKCLEITRIHKMEALFRMSHNLRQLTDYHVKVYTEGPDDAKFYESVYHALLKRCNNLRKANDLTEMTTRSVVMFNGIEKRYLSRRHQMSFYSVSKMKKGKLATKGSGGCNDVIANVNSEVTSATVLSEPPKKRLKTVEATEGEGERKRARESDEDLNEISNQIGKLNLKVLEQVKLDGIAAQKLTNQEIGNIRHDNPPLAARWLKTRKLYRDPEFYKSYGIVDNDYGKKYENNDSYLEDRIVITPERHSLENYVFDPIIFSCVLNESIENELKHSHFFEKNQGKVEQFLMVCYQIKAALTQNEYNALQAHVDAYFKIIFLVLGAMRKPGNEARQFLDNMKNKISDDTIKFSDHCVTFLTDTLNNTFDLYYPREFMQLEGHHYEDHFFGKMSGKVIKESIIDRLYHPAFKLKFIPLDLAEIFFELNDKILKNINNVIKPSQQTSIKMLLEGSASTTDGLNEEAECSSKYTS